MQQIEYSCPVCGTELSYSDRYPNYVCGFCVDKATDENGRALKFFNTDMGGGFEAIYADTNQRRMSHICFIEGKKCYADEARMGGIVVEIFD